MKQAILKSRIFSLVIEDVCLRLHGPYICRRERHPDSFDGREYSIDEFYRQHRRFFDHPGQFYCVPGAPLAPNREGPVTWGFQSPFASEYPENDRASFDWFQNPQARSRVMLLYAPGWGRPDQGFEAGMCRGLGDHGIDTALLTLPFHQRRAPAGTASGEYFISSNVFWTLENFRQFTAEILAVSRFMRQHYEYVGIIGLSSGGFQAGLASNCEVFDFLFPVVTGCRLGSIMYRSKLSRHMRRDFVAKAMSEDDLNRVWSIADQAVLGRHSKARYCKQYLARYDRVIPVEFQESLWQIYGKPERLDLACSHAGIYFWRNAIVDDIAACVKRLSKKDQW